MTFAATFIALGAMCLAAKAIVILLTGDQPPYLFEVAGLPLGLGLLLVARWTLAQHGSSRRLKVAAALASIAALAATYATVMELASRPIAEPVESVLAVSSGMVPLVAALLIGLRLRATTGSARRIGQRSLLVVLVFLPAIIVGGIAADVAGERYFELGLLVVAGTWLALAHAAWVAANAPDTAPQP